MKFIVTAVSMTRDTRRRAGKAWTAIVDTDLDPRYVLINALAPGDRPKRIEEIYEGEQNLLSNHEITKVVDVREAREAY